MSLKSLPDGADDARLYTGVFQYGFQHKGGSGFSLGSGYACDPKALVGTSEKILRSDGKGFSCIVNPYHRRVSWEKAPAVFRHEGLYPFFRRLFYEVVSVRLFSLDGEENRIRTDFVRMVNQSFRFFIQSSADPFKVCPLQ